MTIAAGVYRPLSVANKSPWSRDEMIYLKEHSDTVPIEDIAEHLNRTVKATKNKAYRMGLSLKLTPKGNEL